MQNEIFTLGIGKAIASGYAMRNCIEFLKTAYLKPLAWIKENGIKYAKIIYINYEPRDQWLENAFNAQFEMNDKNREEIENCEACAIARQYADIGESMVCKNHYALEGMITVTTKDTRSDDDSAEVADEKHYAEMSKFFDENVMDMAFSSYLPFCSRCGKSKPDYVGMMKFADKTQMPITFAFCVACRDSLVQLQIQRTQLPERFGV